MLQHIYLGEFDIRNLHQANLRKLVGVVPQKIDLFSGNVISNIAIGEAEPDLRWLLGICTMLGIAEFVEKLPGGFDAQLGENGLNLSGGQRQRLAIARALYKEADILILDEATSSLDSASEQYVQAAIQLMREKEKTVILLFIA